MNFYKDPKKLKVNFGALASVVCQCGSVSWSFVPYTRRWQVLFPARVHAQIAGLVSSWGACCRQMSLFLSLIIFFKKESNL